VTLTDAALTNIELAREALERLDNQLIGLLESRRVMSNHIGTLKADAGLPRTDINQESKVLDRYRDRLGPYAGHLAEEILKYSKHRA
jgi:chorismate mutase